MLKTERVAALFDEARAISADSLELLDDAEKHWDRRGLLKSAEKAWAAATQATNGLILAHAGVEPVPDGGDNDTVGWLSRLAEEGPELEELKDQYIDLSVYLFDLVLCNGSLDPLESTIEEIRYIADYILDCERLARG